MKISSRRASALSVAVLFLASAGLCAEPVYDLVVYGSSPAAIAAAVQARRMGASCVVVSPETRIGGLTTGGLGQTDIGNKAAFGGIALEFYRDVAAYYRDPAHWTWQEPEDYSPDGQCFGTKGSDAMWTFEPSAALRILEGWERRDKLDIRRGERLDRRPGGVTTKDGRIISFRTRSGKTFAGRVFVDATYEGDLLAAAGVSYVVGREANDVYGETISGVQRKLARNHQFNPRVSAYVRPGDPSSGLLPFVERDDGAADGSGDRRVQAYCFRMCLTDVPENRIPFARPADYDERNYELLLRNLEAIPPETFEKNRETPWRYMPWINSAMPNRKTDTNNRTGFSTDFVGQNWSWPEASDEAREKILKAHLSYQKGLVWTLANNPRVPAPIREEVAKWGTCRDEFADGLGGGWQGQLYVREARRLVGDYVMTERHCRGTETAPRPVALGAYGMDSHNVRRYVDADGFVRNEGNVEDYSANLPGQPFRRFPPFPIDYGALVPKRGECRNLLVPVCLLASHMAFGAIRMEPVFFALGQVAGTAGALAAQSGAAVQDVPYDRLRARLLADGQVVEAPVPALTVAEIAAMPREIPSVGAENGVLTWTPRGDDGHLRRLKGVVTYASASDGFFVVQRRDRAVRAFLEVGDYPRVGASVEDPADKARREAKEKKWAESVGKTRSKAKRLLETSGSLIPAPKNPGDPYCSLVSTTPGKMVNSYREYGLPEGVEALELTWKWKVTNLKTGAKPWFDARVLLKFKDASGKEIKPEPSPSYVQRDTNGWQDRRNAFLVPKEAVRLVVMPCLFNVKSGEMVVTDMKLAPTDAEPLRLARAERERQLKARQVPDEPENRAKWPKELKVAGNRLVTADGGAEVWLQGVNAGGLESVPNTEQVVKSVVVALDDWKANCVRLPVIETFWSGGSGYQNDGGAAYRAAVDKIVRLAANRGAYVVLDLHRFRAPKAEHVAFWKDAAKRYANHPAVLFDLFNEPHDIDWKTWRDGGFVGDPGAKDESAFLPAEEKRKNAGFESVGMQALVEAVRSTGARNVVVAGGLKWANDLSGIANDEGKPTFELTDATGNGIMYSWHTYHWHKGWARILPVAAKHPVYLGEVGAAPREEMTFISLDWKEDPYTFAPDMIGFVQRHRINWTAWCFHPSAAPCIIKSWNYDPTPYWGAFVQRALRGEKFEMKRMR